MDLLLSFFSLIIAIVIGICIGLILDIKSYLKIAFIIVCIFIPMELYNEFATNKKIHNATPIPNSYANTISITKGITPNHTPNNTPNHTPNNTPNNTPNHTPNNTISIHPDYYPVKDDANNRFARQKDLEDSKFAIFKRTDDKGNEKNSLPLDNLEPKMLVSKLDYIYYATANPYKPITYTDFKTHADKYLEQDGMKLSANNIDPKLLASSRAYYPQLTSNQIDARDCLNSGSSKDSCFQSPQLFSNFANKFSILGKGVNEDNSNLIIREDFSNLMKLNTNDRYEPVMFKNAPMGNLDKILDNESNESIILDNSTSLCRNCKISKCKNDICSLQNSLFM